MFGQEVRLDVAVTLSTQFAAGFTDTFPVQESGSVELLHEKSVVTSGFTNATYL